MYRPSQRSVLLHVHLFKNAGSSIDWALRRSFGRAFAEFADASTVYRGGMSGLEKLLAENPGVRAASSHGMPFDPAQQPPFGCIWILMLRDPLDRVGSMYTFHANQSPTCNRGACLANEGSISDYVRWGLSSEAGIEIRNFQTRYVAGARRRSIPVRQKHLEKAFDALLHESVIYGLVERFDESMVLFEERLRPVFPGIDLSYVIRNRGRRGSLEERKTKLRRALGDDMYKRLTFSNGFDIELHKRLLASHNRMTDGVVDFDAKLAEFRARCARRFKLFWYWRDKIGAAKRAASGWAK
jgi:hypothetical protein